DANAREAHLVEPRIGELDAVGLGDLRPRDEVEGPHPFVRARARCREERREEKSEAERVTHRADGVAEGREHARSSSMKRGEICTEEAHLSEDALLRALSGGVQ